MGEVAKSVRLNGGFVTGVIPKFLKITENVYQDANETIVVNSMSKRKELLYKKADAFIALPGGPGTIEEITEIISWFNLGLHCKPVILFNYNEFWDYPSYKTTI